jgi:hypothetical protein
VTLTAGFIALFGLSLSPLLDKKNSSLRALLTRRREEEREEEKG